MSLRIDLLQRRGVETQRLGHAGAEILHHDIAARRETADHFMRGRRLQIERDRPLAGVSGDERAAHQLEPAMRGVVTEIVAEARAFDLHHIGAEQTEMIRAEWSR